MSKEIVTIQSDDDSEEQSLIQIEAVILKSLQSCENVIQEQLLLQLHQRYEEISNSNLQLSQFIQYYVHMLINQVSEIKQKSAIDVNRQDYEMLENSIQKSEAEIRKHIRIQQQLKLYMDGIEETNQELQKKLLIEEQKFMNLYESLKEIDEERKKYKQIAMKYEEREAKNKSGVEKQPRNKSGFESIYNPPQKSRNKQMIQKIHQRVNKLGEKKSQNNLKFIEGSIQINLSNNIVVSKKSSIDNSHQKNFMQMKNPTNQSSIRQLTRTVNMKDKRPQRKLSKYKTENSSQDKKRQIRSNSVTN